MENDVSAVLFPRLRGPFVKITRLTGSQFVGDFLQSCFVLVLIKQVNILNIVLLILYLGIEVLHPRKRVFGLISCFYDDLSNKASFSVRILKGKNRGMLNRKLELMSN